MSMTAGLVTQIEGTTFTKVLGQEHPCVFAEQQRGLCSWKGVKEE